MMDTTPAEPLLFSVSGLARRLGITNHTLRNWIAGNADFPPPRRIGTRPFFLLAEVQEWIKNQPTWKGGADVQAD